MRSLHDLTDLGLEAPEEVAGTFEEPVCDDADGESAERILARHVEMLGLSREVRRAGKSAMRAALATEALGGISASLSRLEAGLERVARQVAEGDPHPTGTQPERLAWQLIGAMDGLDALRSLLSHPAGPAARPPGQGQGSAPGPAHSLDARSIADGLALVQARLEAALAQAGASRVLARGAPFDPRLHEAVGAVGAAAPEGTVVDEEAAGYMHDGKVLRFARVVVARPATTDDTPLEPIEAGGEASPLAGPDRSFLGRLWRRLRGERTAA